MQTDPIAAPDSDPLKAVADAMDAAVQAVKEGAESAKLTAADAWPAASQFLSRAVYKTSYAVSYGLVFPAALISRSIPRNNAFVHGLVDGARAASDAVRSTGDAPADPEPIP
jgi:hypothetical protein